MTEPSQAPFGSWKSPITSELIVSGSIRIGLVALDGEDIFWTEGRPTEGGRQVVVKRRPDGSTTELNRAPLNARTRVHEYGGGEFLVDKGTVYFSNFSDQKLYRVRDGSDPEALTDSGSMRYADGVIDAERGRLICLREDHGASDQEATNAIAAIDLETGAESVLVSGSDFYSTPRLSPDGGQLAWLQWNHPNMPWDGCELRVAKIDASGALGRESILVAGGIKESIFQPQWSPDGVLYFVSDRSDWWNLYRWQNGTIEPVAPMESEFGAPQWGFGMSTYAFASADRIICTFNQRGTWSLATIETGSGTLRPIETPFSDFHQMRATATKAICICGSPSRSTALVSIDLDSGSIEVLKKASEVEVGDGYISQPETIEFPTEDGVSAYGFFYPPRNADFIAPDSELPPLLVMSHGGPTGATSPTLSLRSQYWTSRGVAVFDVNYGGSSGYGRPYRERLNDNWGIVDVNDCSNGARFLADQDRADGDRLAITGGSAGGYTTLCALAFRDVFKAGASHFGVADLEALALDTHKFESRYLDGLIGPYPERKDLYDQRSPIHNVDGLSCPVIFFQGLEDAIVPPNQAETMVAALRDKGLPVAYLPFEGEQHGFRRAENIQRSLDGEIYFYSRVFGFDLADDVEPVMIENLHA